MKDAPWVIFSDLDESLLDRSDYSFDEARPALDEVQRRGIPLVLCTSKTAGETLRFQSLLGIEGPFVVEGGGGVYVPRGWFERLPGTPQVRGRHLLLPLAESRDEVLQGLSYLKECTGNGIRGFDDMSAEEIAEETGLPLEMAVLAKDREFDEPFKFVRGEDEFASHLPRLAYERRLRVTRGGRYYHLHGDTDKGRGVDLLLRLYRRRFGRVRSLAVGDSEMDLPMLAAVDRPIAVQRPDGRHDFVLSSRVKGILRVEAPGPAGWNRGVLEVLAGG